MNWKIFTIIILIVALSIGLYIMPKESALFTLTNNNEIKIGIILPLTGNGSDGGLYAKTGIDIALQKINNDTNKKYKIKLIYEDSKYNSEESTKAINKLIDIDNVKFIIGDGGSSQTLAIAPIAEKNKIILISPASQASNISQSGDYIFRTQTSASLETKEFAKYLNDKNIKKIAILAINTDYGKTYINEIKKDFKGEVYSELHNKDEINFKDTLIKLNNLKPEIVIFATVRQAAAEILKESKEMDYNFTFYGSSSSISGYFLTLAGNLGDGLVFISPYNMNLNSTTKEFTDEYYKTYNEKPDMLSANGYDALNILSDCFEKYGNDVEVVKTCIYNTQNYSGASGVFSFDANGDVIKPFYMYTIQYGEFVSLQ